jgi:threonine/homoserine/homoserine lactone efflux protein
MQMTITLYELALYAGGLVLLWMVPGPVWVALTARALTGGFAAAWPLAVGVAIGDVLWPLCAIFGLSWVLSVYGNFLAVMGWVAALVFVVMGILLIRKPAGPLNADSRMTKPGRLAGFLVGVAAVMGNLCLALFLDRARSLLSSPESLRRMNVISGMLLIAVGIVIGLGNT